MIIVLHEGHYVMSSSYIDVVNSRFKVVYLYKQVETMREQEGDGPESR